MQLLRFALLLGLASYFCTGCVAYQIRDELRATNQQVANMNGRLDKISAELEKMNASVAQTNQRLETSDRSLAGLDASMEPIQVSLRRIDEELGGFRQTIDVISKYLPSLGHSETQPSPKPQTTGP